MDNETSKQMEWDSESRKAINDYLDAVENVLLEQKSSRSERTHILGELEAQIHAMVAAKLESGSQLDYALVAGVIETLDAPETYRLENDSQAESVSGKVESNTASESEIDRERNGDNDEQSASSASESTKKSARIPFPKIPLADLSAKAQSYWNRARMDEFSIISCLFGVFGLFMGLASGWRNEFAVLASAFFLVAGCAAGWYSVYRIKRSNGRLWGGRWAFGGAMVLPILLFNAVAFGIVVATPLWAILLFAIAIYVNWLLIQRAWRLLACQQLRNRPAAVVVEPPVPLGGRSVPAL